MTFFLSVEMQLSNVSLIFLQHINSSAHKPIGKWDSISKIRFGSLSLVVRILLPVLSCQTHQLSTRAHDAQKKLCQNVFVFILEYYCFRHHQILIFDEIHLLYQQYFLLIHRLYYFVYSFWKKYNWSINNREFSFWIQLCLVLAMIGLSPYASHSLPYCVVGRNGNFKWRDQIGVCGVWGMRW